MCNPRLEFCVHEEKMCADWFLEFYLVCAKWQGGGRGTQYWGNNVLFCGSNGAWEHTQIRTDSKIMACFTVQML